MFSAAVADAGETWIALTVQVAVALIGAGTAVFVAFAASRTQTKIAADQRASAAEREERAVRETVMESIVGALSELSADYQRGVAALRHIGDDPEISRRHLPRLKLNKALTRLTTRLGRRDLYLAVIEWLEAFSLSFPITRGEAAVRVLQHRLDDWYLEVATLPETIQRLKADRDMFLQERFPSS